MGKAHQPKLDETLPAHPNTTALKRPWFYILLVAFHLSAFWLIKDLPFLGDSIPSNLYAAENIYNHNFTTIWNIPNADPGHGTLYPFITALFWVVLGKSLWVTHLVQVAAGFSLVLLIHKIARHHRDERTAMFAALLFAVSPLYVAQLTNASLQLPLTLATFAAFYFWQQKKYTAYCITLCLLVLCHLQGAFLLLFLCANDAVMDAIDNGYKKFPLWVYKRFWVYSIPLLVFATWGLLHYNQFGWAFTSPNYERNSPSFKWLLYNLAIALWRIIDFGYLIPVAGVLLFFFWHRKKLFLGDSKVKTLITYFLILIIVGGGISIIFAHPPIHRYFLPSTVLLCILFAAVLERRKPSSQRIWAILAGIFLVWGNFMYYPGKCIGDANIAYLPVFNLEKRVEAGFPKGTVFYTYAPLSYPSSIRYLDSSKGLRLTGLYDTPIDSVTYVLQSNMNCEFTPEELEKLAKWHGTSYEQGGIYINIFANPAFVPQKPKGWRLRQPSAAELLIQRTKGNFK